MHDHVLLPTDGSENAERAVEQAVDLASSYDATLHLLYVVDVKHMTSDAAETLMGDQLEHAGQAAVDAIAERAERSGLTVNSTVAPGTPAQGILNYVADNDIDIIVMGTRGRTGLDRLLVGSVTEKVVRLSDVPVLTVPMAQ